jgi:hypothetical protein
MKGKIYRIVLECEGESKEYIGSTASTLSNRFSKHKTNFKMWKDGRTTFVSSFSLFEKGEPTIILIEEFDCVCKKDLERREREIILSRKKDGFNVINAVLPAMTDEEFRIYHKEYNQKNKDKKKEYNVKYRELNKEKIKTKKRETYELNKEAIKARMSKPTSCDHCGQVVQKSGMAEHKRSKICAEYLAKGLKDDGDD